MEALEDRLLLKSCTITADIVQPGEAYTLENCDANTITIGDGVTIDTSKPGGIAGAITFSAHTINIGKNVKLLATGATPGAITLTADHTLADPGLAYWDFLGTLTTVTAGLSSSIVIGTDVTIHGGAFTASATAGDSDLFSDLVQASPYVGQLVKQLANQVTAYLNDLTALPISVVVKQPSAILTVGAGASITSSGNVSLQTTSTANALSEALFSTLLDWGFSKKDSEGNAAKNSPLGVAIGVGHTDVKAETTIARDVRINAGGDVSIRSNATNKLLMTARVTQNIGMNPTNPNNVQVSLGVTVLNTTSTALVDAGSAITAAGTVEVTAMGSDRNKVQVDTASYYDGLAGIGLAVGFTTADVTATVKGAITAGARPAVLSQSFNPALTVDFATSSIRFPAAPGFQSGDAVAYRSGLGGAIPGLVTGTTYYAIVSAGQPQVLQLAASYADAMVGKPIPFGPAYPTLTTAAGRAVPLTSVQGQGDGPEDRNLFLFDYDSWPDGTPLFTEGQAVTYSPAPGHYLGENDAAGQLLGPLPAGSYQVHVVQGTADSQDQYAIQLRDAAGNTVALNDNPLFTTASGQRLQVYSFDADAGTVNFNFPENSLADQGLSLTTGTPLTYTQGLGTWVTGFQDGQTYYAIVDSAHPGIVQLAASPSQAQAAGSSIKLVQPTLTAGSQTLKIGSVEPETGLIFTANPNLADGTAVTYQAVPGKPIGGLEDGRTYYAYNQANANFDSDSPAYILSLKDAAGNPVALSLLQQTLTDSEGTAYTVQSTDAVHHVLAIASPSPLVLTAADDTALVGGASDLQAVPAGAQQVWTSLSGGFFTLSAVVDGQTQPTLPLSHSATAAQVQAALNRLTGLATSVTGLGTYADPWLIRADHLPTVMAHASPQLWTNAKGGTFRLSVSVADRAVSTAALAFDATAAQVQAALDELPGVTATVTGSGTATDPYVINGISLSDLSVEDADLDGGEDELEVALEVSGNCWVKVVATGSQLLSNVATGGQFRLTARQDASTAVTTAPLAYNAPAAQVQAALEALPGLGLQPVVTGSGTPADPWVISGRRFSIQSGDPLTFGDAYGQGSNGLLAGQTYYAAVAPSQPYPGKLLLALAATATAAREASPVVVSLQEKVDLGQVNTSYMSGSQHVLEPLDNSAGITIRAELQSAD